jgi:hypothetical protein
MAQINDGAHIVNIIERQPCQKHEAGKGIACFKIPSDISDRILLAICNKRAVKAGANGKISDSSRAVKNRNKRTS